MLTIPITPGRSRERKDGSVPDTFVKSIEVEIPA